MREHFYKLFTPTLVSRNFPTLFFELWRRLLTPPLKHEHASEQQCRNILADAGILSPTSSGNPKYIDYYLFIWWWENIATKRIYRFDKKVRELVVALDKLRPIENAPATRPDSEALQKLDRGLLELLKIFQQNSVCLYCSSV